MSEPTFLKGRACFDCGRKVPDDFPYDFCEYHKESGELARKAVDEDILKAINDIDKIPEILIPSSGKLISEFAGEVATLMKDTGKIFFRIDARDLVEIQEIKTSKTSSETFIGFAPITAGKFVTIVEKYVQPMSPSRFGLEKKSIGMNCATIVLASNNFQNEMPRIKRIFTIPLPIIYEGNLTFPNFCYDRRFSSWMPPDAPKISNEKMTLEEAKEVFNFILKEFCFQQEQDRSNALAAMLTPFLRGLFPTFNTRTPLFFYLANRERAGKDYLAGITGIIYEGCALEEAPISTGADGKFGNSEELRKKIMAAMLSGRKRLHFANNKGVINNAVLEGIITATKYSDRILGRSEILTFDNEMDFSLSGNTGITYTPDFANRARLIRLFLDIEDANARRFNNPNLHMWVFNNRDLILSAFFALVRNWYEKGKPAGTLPFSSFPQWAEVCGGIMEAAGYINPCQPDTSVILLGGDAETLEMKRLFELCYAEYPERLIDRQNMKEIALNNDIFSNYDFTKREDNMAFAKIVFKYIGRVLSGIKMKVESLDVRAARIRYLFTKEEKQKQL